MIARIGRIAYNMSTEMSDWQTEDMHRDKPYTKRNVRAKTVLTRVRPHSLKRMRKSERVRKRLRKRALFPSRTSTRPILRQVLIDKLGERMGEMMAERLQWQRGTSSESTDGS